MFRPLKSSQRQVPKERASMFEPLENRLLCTRAEGVDVASFQGTPNWGSVYAAGKRFVIAKATEGTTYTNPDYTQQIGATGSSLVAGAYHFASYGSATAEADHFYAVASGAMKAGYLRPTLDIEGSVPSGWGKTTVSNWVDNFGAEVTAKSGGASMMVYTSQSYAASYFDSSVTQYNFWIAHYNGQNSQTGSPGTTTPFSTWAIWQYTSTGTVSGISGNVDHDVANGTMTGYVIPSLVQSHDAKFNTGQTVHVTNAPSGLKAWNTYTSNGTYVVEPDGTAGVVQMSHPVFIQGYKRWEIKYSGDSTNRWSAEDWLA
jgi:GH25 family lysozyme M1 (1,4-beta-N-acetylmuramidase)